MRKFLLSTACVIAVCAGYWVGLRQAAADDMPSCFVCEDAPLPPICGNCQGNDCPACDQGTCPGNLKTCHLNETCPLRPANGSLSVTLVKYACFSIEGCKPASGDHCSLPGQIGCVGDGHFQYSSTTFSVPIGSGDCRYVPG